MTPSPSLSLRLLSIWLLLFLIVFRLILHPRLLLFSRFLFLHSPPHGLVQLAPPSSFPMLFASPLHSSFSLRRRLRFFMSFWPWSHFPNWLSGSLIMRWHPCCCLFYLAACRRPNPLIGKHPSSAHTASQQPASSPVCFSTVHIDGSLHFPQAITVKNKFEGSTRERSSRILFWHSDGPKNLRFFSAVHSESTASVLEVKCFSKAVTAGMNSTKTFLNVFLLWQHQAIIIPFNPLL